MNDIKRVVAKTTGSEINVANASKLRSTVHKQPRTKKKQNH